MDNWKLLLSVLKILSPNNIVQYDKIDSLFEYPAHITNAIVIDHLNNSIINELETLQCEYIQMFFLIL